MNVKESKRYLKQIERLTLRIDMLKDELEELQELTASVGSQPHGERVSTMPTSRVERLMVKIQKKEEEIFLAHLDLVDTREKILQEIDKLADIRFVKILTFRYVKCLKMADVAKALHYEYKWCCRLHSQALDAFGKSKSQTRTNTN